MSAVWRFFKRPSGGKQATAYCSRCRRDYSYQGSTSTLIKHLKSRHTEEWEKITKESESVAMTHESSTSDKLLAMALCTGNIPFRFVENREFVEFSRSIGFRPPSRKIMRRLLDENASNYLLKIRDELKNAKNLTVITDGYSDRRNTFSFYSLHLYYIDTDFVRKLKFIGVRCVRNGTAMEIGKIVPELLDTVQVSSIQVTAYVTDGARTLRSMANTQQTPQVHCSCHLVNLVFESIGKLTEVRKIQEKVQKIACTLARNKELRRKVKEVSTGLQIKTPLPIPLSPTRWAALYLLFKAYKDNERSILSISEIREHVICSSDSKVMESYLQLMEPLYAVLREFEKDYSFCSEIVPRLLSCREKIDKQMTSASARVSSILNARIDSYFENVFVMRAMLFDARFAYREKIVSLFEWDRIEKNYTDIMDDMSTPLTDTACSPGRSRASSLSDMDAFLNGGASSSSQTTLSFLNYRNHLTSNRPKFDDSPLVFWRVNKGLFPKLSELARPFLTSPASSSASERLFSKCSDYIRNPKRAALNTETLNRMLLNNALANIESQREEFWDDEDDDEIESSEDEAELNKPVQRSHNVNRKRPRNHSVQ